MLQWFCSSFLVGEYLYFTVWETPRHQVPEAGHNVTVFFNEQQWFLSSRRRGKGRFLTPTKTGTRALQLGQAFNSLGLLRVKAHQRCAWDEVLRERPSEGWEKKLALWCSPLWTGNEKDCCGRRGGERESPKVTSVPVWTYKHQPCFCDFTYSSLSTNSGKA